MTFPSVPTTAPTRLFRVSHHPHWSTHRFPKGTNLANSQYRMFVVARGGSAGQGFTGSLSYADTNLKTGGMLNGGASMDITDIAFEIISQKEDQRGLARGVCSWDFVQSVVSSGPIAAPPTTYDEVLSEWAKLTVTPKRAGGLSFPDDRDPTGEKILEIPPLEFDSAPVTTSGRRLVPYEETAVGLRGLQTYTDYAVSLPGNCTFGMLLSFPSEDNVLSDDAYIRITLIGKTKSVIEFG